MAPNNAQSPGSIQDQRLNTKDLENALDLAFSFGKPRNEDNTFKVFEYLFDARDALFNLFNSNQQFQKFMASDIGIRINAQILKALDADGDGRLTPRDFQIMYDRDLKNLLRRNESVLNEVLPLAGQCVFGFTVGYFAGQLAHRLYRSKFIILSTGVAAYSALQYMAQKNFVNQKVLEKAFQEKLKELADVNGDGVLDKKDIDFLLQNRLQYVTTKLGPGGIAPGAVGYATLGLGILRGMRRI
ncbi:EF-hand domain [Trypanosoma melophagium]|uniref:EF-hand domain n=1 Tax=Trypanosoma melophagium TaxID=715481 RepID=UPI00351A1356|nr:EF-hand domain [Trypanosoma melophagium]